MSDNPRLRNSRTGAVIEVNANPFYIGRGLNCNYVLPSTAISRIHCVLEKKANVWILRDTSTNGTFLNDVLYAKQSSPPLNHKDRIGLNLPLEIYYFECEECLSSDDISDEQLCMIADSVFHEVERSHSESEPMIIGQCPNDASIMFPTTSNTSPSSNGRTLINSIVATLTSNVLPPNITSATSVPLNVANGPPTVCRAGDLEVMLPQPVVTDTGIPVMLNNGEPTPIHANLPVKPGPSKEDEKPPDEVSMTDVTSKPSATEMELQEKYEVMENELQCAICSELFVKAVTLNCSHSFCKHCIGMWKKTKQDCPICRTKITAVTATIVLDNVIEKVIDSSTIEAKEQRKRLLDERKELEKPVQAPKATISPQDTSQRGHSGRRGGRGGGRRGRTRNNSANVPYAIPVVELSSASDTDSDSTSSTESETDTDNWQFEYDNDEWYDTGDYDYYDECDYFEWYEPGNPGAYYGGYGHCFICGARGHWANGCPNR